MKTIKKLTIGMLLSAALVPASAQHIKGCPEELQEAMREPVALYQDNWKQYVASNDERYLLEAYPYWKTFVEKCPSNGKNIYTRGVNIMEVKIKNAKTEEEKAGYIEELMALYDTRIATFGEAGKVTAMKAMELENLLGAAGLERYYKLYSDAVNMEGGLEAGYLVKYMEATINYVRAGYAEPTLVVDNYDIASDMLEDELQKNIADSAKAAEIRGYIAGVEAAFSPYASCEQLVDIYGKKFEADPENVDLLKKITGIMTRKRCTKEELFFRATENLYRLEPTPSTAMRMGMMCLEKEQYSDAIKYLGDATKGVEGKDKYTAYLYLGHAYAGQKSYSAARTAYNNAAAADATKGEPYMRIAILYGQSTGSASEDNVNGRSAYWAAVDALNKAKSVEPTDENIEQCNKLISTYAAHFPKQTDAFMAGLQPGARFTVPGWIGVSTTVRTR
ncbi:MAG: hypothetical protein IJ524_02410 [Bacteroidales bacterium]|nr:hypothetical protein [Bacteroidales bacterium]